MLLLSILKVVYRKIIYIIINYNLFKAIYEYNLILKLYLENKTIKEKIFVIKKRVKEINLVK